MNDTDSTFDSLKKALIEVVDFVLFGIWVAMTIATVMFMIIVMLRKG